MLNPPNKANKDNKIIISRVTFLLAIIILAPAWIFSYLIVCPQSLALLPPGCEVRDNQVFHKIEKGQNLYMLANKYLPLTNSYTPAHLVAELIRINSLKNTVLAIGMELKIPVVRFSQSTAKTIPQKKEFVARGIYITGISAGSERVLRLALHLKRLGGNTVVFDAKDMSGIVFYPSRIKLAEEIKATTRAPIRDIGKMISQLHEKGIHVAARIVLFHDQLLAENRQDLAVRSRSTGSTWLVRGKPAWVDPSLKEVQRYNLDLAKELTALGVDEIQFDYIRFPAMGNTDDAEYSFDEKKVSKHEIITGFLKQAYRELHPLGVLVSIDVYGITIWEKETDVEIIGQKIEDLARYTDIISPMLYPSHFAEYFGNKPVPADEPYYFVYSGCKKIAEVTKGTGVTIRPWLQAFPFRVTDFKEDYILEQIKAARAASTTGWLLWDADNSYEVALRALHSLRNENY